MTYIVSKRKGVWTVGAGGVVMNFDDYSSAIDTARGAAQVLKDVRAKGGPAAIAVQRPVFRPGDTHRRDPDAVLLTSALA
jgi:hypothetical protein